MSSFDESKHPRNRGKFTAVSHREPEAALTTGFDARYWGLPESRPGSWVFGTSRYAETAAGSVVDGPLSRGVAGKDSLDSFRRWQDAAAGYGTAEGDDFAAGLEDGLRALCRSDGSESAAELLDTAASVPTTETARVNWMLGLKAAPTTAGYRGRLAAGVILSGSDQWWGISNDPDLAINGPAQDIPRARGAWASLAG
ncbi:hypothetical protein [Pseudarthrobacter sp. BIM B-2242]|uniref:hypothetical protein n=1 Tax=Pseudarthrobacter sp. BIM B-2242 TaxID=2772401 RepID=UPI00168B2EA5|nr:hypothetical protein [Pseudarthrobacter sp. BIM B-2242]QOD05843.1 hypothetical protein IDT60_22905 [Pseudarthrobacter sp. BIM B-2242]